MASTSPVDPEEIQIMRTISNIYNKRTSSTSAPDRCLTCCTALTEQNKYISKKISKHTKHLCISCSDKRKKYVVLMKRDIAAKNRLMKNGEIYKKRRRIYNKYSIKRKYQGPSLDVAKSSIDILFDEHIKLMPQSVLLVGTKIFGIDEYLIVKNIDGTVIETHENFADIKESKQYDMLIGNTNIHNIDNFLRSAVAHVKRNTYVVIICDKFSPLINNFAEIYANSLENFVVDMQSNNFCFQGGRHDFGLNTDTVKKNDVVAVLIGKIKEIN